DNTLRFTPFNIEKDTPIVTTVTPCPCLAPINPTFLDAAKLPGIRLQRQISLAYQPLIYANAAVHFLRAMIGHDKNGGVIIDKFEYLTNLIIEIAVIVMDAAIVHRVDFMLMMRGIVVLP